jgi:parallel beta-helix repeat protein
MRRLLLPLSLAVLVCGVSAVPASGSHVSCGQVITQDTTLDSDLINCPSDGVIIGADSITLDLAGHVIDGTGNAASGAGVDNDAGHDGVTIQNGWIEEFQSPVYFDHGDGGLLRRLTVTAGQQGPLQLWHSDSNTIRLNVILTGVNLYGDSDGNTINRNTIDTVGTGVLLAGLPAVPPDPHQFGNANTVTSNTITGHGESYGIYVAFNDDALIQANAVRDQGGTGILLSGSGTSNQVLGNAVTGSGLQGIYLAGVQRNALVRSNQVTENALDGILLGSSTREAVVQQNNSSHNGDDGIDSDSASVTLTGNKAKYNDDLGIEAEPGVTDGGGNVARGNGNPAQCVGVTCTN